MEKANTVKILEVCKISPSPHSSNFSLSLSAFDWMFMKFPPIKRVFFYSITDSDSIFDSILGKLKHSLSLTLHHFLPLAGNLVWPDHSPLPFILYAPNEAAVSFTVAETDSDFHHVSGNHARQLKDSHSLVPNIQSSDTAIPLMAVQVTKFPNHGFSIGFAFHHVIFDGQSFSLFFKSWAHICKLNQIESCPLPPELTPSFERGSNVLRNPFDFVPENKSLKYNSFLKAPSDWFRATFELTPTHIQKLKKRVLDSMEKTSSEEFHISTFVVAYAYVLIYLMKAKEGECGEHILLLLTADARGLMNPPISSNYFGNCVIHPGMRVEAREFREEGGFPKIAKKISDLILELRRTRAVEVRKPSELEQHNFLSGVEVCSVAASPKYKLYETDFGWGKPKKIEILSLGSNNISLTDTRDGGGAVEVGLVLPPHQMDIFASLFAMDLN